MFELRSISGRLLGRATTLDSARSLGKEIMFQDDRTFISIYNNNCIVERLTHSTFTAHKTEVYGK
jgi:hypothetical protein